MILHCNYEELTALASAAERVLSDMAGDGMVVAPPRAFGDLEALLPRVTGDVSLTTLDEQRSVQRALELVLEQSHVRMNGYVLDQHPAAEHALNAYFEYAYVLAILDRTRRIGAEMTMLIELMTGRAPDDETARTLSFPD
jgi:hypothetical protein